MIFQNPSADRYREWLKCQGLKCPLFNTRLGVEKSKVEKSRVEKFMVEKSRVGKFMVEKAGGERSGVEAWG